MQQQHEPSIEQVGEVQAGDRELLSEYATTGAESAFARLVERYVDLVYSAAFRQTENHTMAEDVAQAVFMILARKAGSLRRETVLAGWLFRAVRYAALDARKIDARRQKREEEAAQMQLTEAIDESGNEWEQFAPLLDEAMSALGAKDRHAILLRFFEKKSFGEIGETLGGNENSARVRVVRAVDKLRGFLRRRGVAVTAAALSGALLSNAVQAAPPALAAAIANHATGAKLVEALLRRLLWRRIVQAGIVVLLLLLLFGGAGLIIQQRRAAQAAALADAARSVRNLMIAIDSTYGLNDPNGFVALIYFRNAQDEQFRAVLADYVRAQWLFREEMRRALNVRQRSFNATFGELCVIHSPRPTNYLRLDSAATNIMMAKFPVHFVKTDGAWKWDLFDGLSPEMRAQRFANLRAKTAMMDKLTPQIHEKAATNVEEILETFQKAGP